VTFDPQIPQIPQIFSRWKREANSLTKGDKWQRQKEYLPPRNKIQKNYSAADKKRDSSLRSE
jgi:hypothetical protein